MRSYDGVIKVEIASGTTNRTMIANTSAAGIALAMADEEPQLAQKEQIEVIPTFVLYKNGKAIDSIVAPDSKAMLERFIKEALEK